MITGALIYVFLLKAEFVENANESEKTVATFISIFSTFMYLIFALIYIYYVYTKFKKNKDMNSKEKQYNKVVFDGDLFANRMLYTLLGSSMVIPVAGVLHTMKVNYIVDWIPKAMLGVIVLSVILLGIIIGISDNTSGKASKTAWLIMRFAYYCIFMLGLYPFIFTQVITQVNGETKGTNVMKAVAILAGILTTCISIGLYLFDKMYKDRDISSRVAIILYIFGGLIFTGAGFARMNYTKNSIFAIAAPIFLVSIVLGIILGIGGSGIIVPASIGLIICVSVLFLLVGGRAGWLIFKQKLNYMLPAIIIGISLLSVISGIITVFLGSLYGGISAIMLLTMFIGVFIKLNRKTNI
tara:strand:+ start:572 stop:1633 length:1062 start_codon:yes stop_codon:yes gene_type:complete